MPDHDPWGSAAKTLTADRWSSAAAHWGSGLTQALLEAADLNQRSVVLDVAAGSGDPALTIAQRLKEGSVVALDRSCASLLLAKHRAGEMGWGSMLRFVQADVQELPFFDSRFDRVTCRFGVMFFSDIDKALKELRRVLKPRGRAAFLAWGSFEQPFFASTIGTILRLVPHSTIPEPARAMFRFAACGSIREALCHTGFGNVEERHLTLPRIWAGSAQQLWEYFQEIGTPFQPLIRAIPATVQPEVDEAVHAALARFQSGTTITIPARVVLATAES